MEGPELAEFLGRMDAKMDSTLERLERVETKQDYTNGSVRALQMFKARVLGVTVTIVVLAPIVVPLLAR